MCLGRSQVDIYGPCLQVVLFWVARVNRRGTGLLKPLIGHAQLLSSVTSDYCSLYRKLCHDLNLNQSLMVMLGAWSPPMFQDIGAGRTVNAGYRGYPWPAISIYSRIAT